MYRCIMSFNPYVYFLMFINLKKKLGIGQLSKIILGACPHTVPRVQIAHQRLPAVAAEAQLWPLLKAPEWTICSPFGNPA